MADISPSPGMMDTGREELRKIGTEKERFFSKMTKAIGAAPVLYIMAAFTVSWAIIFHYIPMYGILLAFKKFDLSDLPDLFIHINLCSPVRAFNSGKGPYHIAGVSIDHFQSLKS